MPVRKSHLNPSIARLYKEYLVNPLGDKSHHLLHTRYTPRDKALSMQEVLKHYV
jgi:NADP-reducing hydrogenase subunit HndD